MGQIFIFFFWLELFFNMFSVIIWKQNFEKLNRTGLIAPLPPIRPHYHAYTLHHFCKCSNFWTVSKFEVFSTSSGFSCLSLSNGHLKWLSTSIFPVFYESRFLCDYLYGENRKISMNKMLFFSFYIYIPNFKKIGLKI